MFDIFLVEWQQISFYIRWKECKFMRSEKSGQESQFRHTVTMATTFQLLCVAY